jgi:hypothetical protein
MDPEIRGLSVSLNGVWVVFKESGPVVDWETDKHGAMQVTARNFEVSDRDLARWHVWCAKGEEVACYVHVDGELEARGVGKLWFVSADQLGWHGVDYENSAQKRTGRTRGTVEQTKEETWHCGCWRRTSGDSVQSFRCSNKPEQCVGLGPYGDGLTRALEGKPQNQSEIETDSELRQRLIAEVRKIGGEAGCDVREWAEKYTGADLDRCAAAYGLKRHTNPVSPVAMGVPTCGNCGKPVRADGHCAGCGGKYVKNPRPLGEPSEDAKAFNRARALRHAHVLLHAFDCDVRTHLVPLLPDRLRCVTDLIGAYPKHPYGKHVFNGPTLACFVFEKTDRGDREVYHFCRALDDPEPYGPVQAAADATNIGGRLLRLEARGQ